jgi:hypothetical protein
VLNAMGEGTGGLPRKHEAHAVRSPKPTKPTESQFGVTAPKGRRCGGIARLPSRASHRLFLLPHHRSVLAGTRGRLWRGRGSCWGAPAYGGGGGMPPHHHYATGTWSPVADPRIAISRGAG